MTNSTTQGFSLIETLICLSLMGILLSLGYPSLEHALGKAYRLEAKAHLLEAAQRLENYYAEHQTYAGASLTALGVSEWTDKNSYHLELGTKANTYQLRAIAQAQKQPNYLITPNGLELDDG